MTRDEYTARRRAGRLTAAEYAPGAVYWTVRFLGGKGRLEEWRVVRFDPYPPPGGPFFLLEAVLVVTPGGFPSRESGTAVATDELGGYRDPEAALLAALAEVEWEYQERHAWAEAALAAYTGAPVTVTEDPCPRPRP